MYFTASPLGRVFDITALLKGMLSVVAVRGQSVTLTTHTFPFAPETQTLFLFFLFSPPQPPGYVHLDEQQGLRGLSCKHSYSENYSELQGEQKQ